MKLVPITLYDLPHLPPKQWRFKKNNVRGIITKKDNGTFIYELEHPTFNEKITASFDSLEETRQGAEKWIDLWYLLNGRLLAFK